jgi:hypothetical protein
VRIVRSVAWLFGAVVILAAATGIDGDLEFYRVAHLDTRTPLLIHSLVWFGVGLYTGLILIENIKTWNVKPHVLGFFSLPCLLLIVCFFIELYTANIFSMSLFRLFNGNYVQVLFGVSTICGFFGTFRHT